MTRITSITLLTILSIVLLTANLTPYAEAARTIELGESVIYDCVDPTRYPSATVTIEKNGIVIDTYTTSDEIEFTPTSLGVYVIQCDLIWNNGSPAHTTSLTVTVIPETTATITVTPDNPTLGDMVTITCDVKNPKTDVKYWMYLDYKTDYETPSFSFRAEEVDLGEHIVECGPEDPTLQKVLLSVLDSTSFTITETISAPPDPVTPTQTWNIVVDNTTPNKLSITCESNIIDNTTDVDIITFTDGSPPIFFDKTRNVSIQVQDGDTVFIECIDSSTRLNLDSLEYHVQFPTTAIPEPVNKKKSNGSGCNDCTPPWIGYDKEGKLRVSNGISINDVSKDAGLFHTEYPMVYTTIGDRNHIVLDYWENNGPSNIWIVQFGSVKEIGTPLGEADWLMEIYMENFKDDIENPTIEKIDLRDPNGVINDNFTVSVELVDCFQEDELEVQSCLRTHIDYSYDKVQESPVLVSNAIDLKRNGFNNYFNDGITVIDPNPAEEIVEGKYEYKCKDKPLDEIMNGGDRNNCHWRSQLAFWN